MFKPHTPDESGTTVPGDDDWHALSLSQRTGQSAPDCQWRSVADCIAGSAALGGTAVQAIQLPEQFSKLPCVAQHSADTLITKRCGVRPPGVTPQPDEQPEPAQQTCMEGALSGVEDYADDVIYVMCTSGSTGRAKAVRGTASGEPCTILRKTDAPHLKIGPWRLASHCLRASSWAATLECFDCLSTDLISQAQSGQV